MIPTLFGVIVIGLGLMVILFGSSAAMLDFVLFASLFSGSAAITLVSLGGSTVAPAIVALGMLAVRVALPGSAARAWLPAALNANRLLVLFVLYGALGAILLPRIFADAMQVVPLKPLRGRGLFVTTSLRFGAQNITSAGYLVTTLLGAIAAYQVVAAGYPVRRLARVAAAIAVIHALLGFVSIGVLGSGAASLIAGLRNGHYAQASQVSEGIARMSGITPEPALFANYGLAWLVLLGELWLRDIERRWTAVGLAVIALALVVSTSTTGYVGMAGYAAVLIIRQLFNPAMIRAGKTLAVAGVALAGLVAVLALAVAAPSFSAKLGRLIGLVTVDKFSSESGIQRALWARQGIDAFFASYGLGIGAGSFRSSSLVSAILGSSGIIGIVSFSAYLWSVIAPGRATPAPAADPRAAAGAALAWTALVMLVPASVAAPSADPGFLWAMFAGMALAYRGTVTAKE